MRIRQLRLLLVAFAVACEAHAQSCEPAPEVWVGARLLADLPDPIHVARQPAVDATLATNPGAIEAFISSLMSWEFLLDHREDVAGSGVSFSQAETTGGRGMAYIRSPRSPLDVGSTTYVVEGHLNSSPLILDFDADGLPDVAGGQWQPRDGMNFAGPLVAFDWNGDGFAEVTEWLRPDDVLLVAPEDPSRIVVTALGLGWSGPISGRDLLGTAEGYANGFHKLFINWDDDNDGIVTGIELDGLYLWQDGDTDGVADSGELHDPADFDVTAFSEPAPGMCVGTFTRAGLVHAMWDWWPSFVRAHLAAPVVPSSLSLSPVALPNTSYLGAPIPVSPDSRIDRVALEAAGIPLGARLLAVAGQAFILDGTRSHDDEVVRVWMLPLDGFPGGPVVPRIVEVPAVELVQFAFESATTAILVVNDGSGILRLDCTTGALTRLLGPGDGFRCSNLAIALPGGGVAVSGSFHDLARGEGDDVLAAISTSNLTQVANLDDWMDTASTFGTLVGLLVQSPTRAFAVVRPPIGAGQLVHFESGVPHVIATNVAPVGLAAHGNRVMYFQQTLQLSQLRACIFDVAQATNFALAQDDWSYPYLDRAGSRPLATKFDWDANTMTLYSAPTGNGVLFTHVLTSGIGAVRYSEDGSTIACLAAEGLYVLQQSPTDVLAEPAPAPRHMRNVPNPFNPSTMIHFELASTEHVRVDIFDARGRHVVTLLDAPCSVGSHALPWTGIDARGRAVPSGSYIYRLTAGERRSEGKMTLVR